MSIDMSKEIKNILAIDSSTTFLRVGLMGTNGEIFSGENNDRYRHAEFIFPLIDKVISEAKIEKAEIGGIIVSTGPGSFTGLRIGMSAAKGLAVALDIPIVGVSIFNALAGRLYKHYNKAAVVIQSRRDEFYLGIIDAAGFDDNSIMVVNTAQLPEKIGDCRIIAIDIPPENLGIPVCQIINPAEFSVKIDDFIMAGTARLEQTGGDDISTLEPLYIQKFPVKLHI
jgi:tRNA threonylcarbamoyl adenosine modification protein YeaZ